MKFGSPSILGLAISDSHISCAQVTLRGGRRVVQRLGQFNIASEGTFDQPEKLGERLRAFLREHQITASRVVAGVPAKWLIAHEKELPPVDPDQGVAMLRLHAERMNAADGSDIVFDTAGKPHPSDPTRVLLVGILRSQLDRIETMCGAAGLTISSVTSTSMAVSQLLSAGDNQSIVLVTGQSAEFVSLHNGTPKVLRHFAAGAPSGGLVQLTSELRRALILDPAGQRSGELLLLGEREFPKSDIKEMSDRLELNVSADRSMNHLQAEVEHKALNGAAGNATADSFLPAAALAIAGLSRKFPTVDFAHSQLAPPRQRRISERTILITGAAALAILLLGYLYFTVQQREAEVVQLETQLKLMEADIAAARTRVDRFEFGRTYYTARPATLEAIRQITMAFSQEDPVWVTGFNLRDTGRGSIRGKATDHRAVLALRDRLMANPAFEGIQLQDSREAGGRSNEFTFAISFQFVSQE